MKRIHLTLFLTLAGIMHLNAQYSETIQTSRPGQAFVPFSVGQHMFQVQSGLTYSGFDDSDNNRDGNSTDFNALLRYGLLEDFEIRTAFNINSSTTNLENGSDSDLGGLSAMSIGVRYNIISGEGNKPSFGFQTDLGLNWVDEDFNPEDIAPKITLIHSQNLSEKIGLTTNWALSWDGNDNATTGNYVINIAFPLGDKLGGFIENYGSIDNGKITHRWDTGLGYLINNNLLIDCSIGYGKNDGLSDWFVDAGISWRTKLK